MEVFSDLVFVVAVASVGQRWGPAPSVPGLAAGLGLFTVIWWAWLGQSFYDTRYETDDQQHRLLVLTSMVGAGALTLGARTAPAGVLFPLGYLVVRGCLLLMYGRAARSDASARQVGVVYLPGFGVGWLCWLGSLSAPPQSRPWWWAAGLLVDLATPWLGRRWLARVPVDNRHLPERMALFTIILLGTSLATLLDAVPTRPQAVVCGSLLLAFLVPASIWWVYSQFLTVDVSVERLRGGQTFAYLHGVLAAALLLNSWSLGAVISTVAHGTAQVPQIVRVALGVSIGAWMITGVALRQTTLGAGTRSRVVFTGAAVLAITTVTTVVTQPVALLAAVAALLVSYAHLARRSLGQAERSRSG
ncbi:low temperature requirement protein A [Micromonospora sp. NPDC092111]|uniref:low temperature requirement protein A n=1 Tax=Micromonospora sp. NPDC092111 TaxID=3364289 RepID=UPI0038254223